MWNDLPYTLFDTRTLDGFMGTVNRRLILIVVFSTVFRGAGACGVAKAINKQLCFSHWASAAGFNINNDDNNLQAIPLASVLLLR